MGFYGKIGAGLNFYNLILIPLKTSVFCKLVFLKVFILNEYLKN